MSLRLTVLLGVAVLLIASFAAVGILTTHISSMDERVVIQNRGGRSPTTRITTRIETPSNRGTALFNRRFLVALAVVASVTLAVAMLMTNRLVLAPIAALTAAVRRMEKGSLDVRVSAGQNDEIGELGRSFNDLASRLARSEARRREMIADIAHELRTPLTNIRGSIESMEDGLIAATTTELRALHADTLLLERLIGDLHDLSASDDGSLRLDRTVLDLGAEIRTAAGSAVPRLLLDLPSDLPLVSCDAARVRQVVQNLLSNALRHSPEGPISIVARCDGDAVRVSVEDGGVGFPPDRAEAIFERFYRVDDSRSRETGGSGLGLAIAKQLIEAHGGQIGAFVNGRRGATVWFTLPLSLE